jgi:RNA polymerase sigma-70 factor (ECF subfamily)
MPIRRPSGQFETRLSLLTRIAKPGPVDQLAWEEFVDQYGPMIYRWCRRWGLQDADAKDVTQQVLLTLPAKMARFQYNPDGSFRAWLHTLAHHAWHDFHSRTRRPIISSGSGQAADPLRLATARDDLVRRLEEEFDLELLDEAVDRVRRRVTEPTWEAFRLTAWNAVPAVEVARQLDKKVATVYVARSKVQRMLQDEIESLRAVQAKEQPATRLPARSHE